jgi:hypothetical protein
MEPAVAPSMAQRMHSGPASHFRVHCANDVKASPGTDGPRDNVHMA